MSVTFAVGLDCVADVDGVMVVVDIVDAVSCQNDQDCYDCGENAVERSMFHGASEP